VDDDATSLGAALAYYSLFSAAPLLLVVISIAGLLFGEFAAREAILSQIESLIGPASSAAVKTGLESLDRPAVGTVAAAVGVVVVEPTDTWMVGALTFAGSVTLGAAIGEVVIHSAHKRKEHHDGQDRD